jgi:hypothetical protein
VLGIDSHSKQCQRHDEYARRIADLSRHRRSFRHDSSTS